MENKDKPNMSWWQPGLALFLRLSGWIGGPAIFGVILGKYLDRKFHTDPWFLLGTVAAAFIVSMVMIVRIGLKEMNKIEKNKKQ